MNVYIDFDHTISPNGYTFRSQTMDLTPIEGAIETIQSLKLHGHRIIIFSCRSNPEVVGEEVVEMKTKEMTDYLIKHSIPFDSVFNDKPNYDIVIDDKAIGFRNNWLQIKKELKV